MGDFFTSGPVFRPGGRFYEEQNIFYGATRPEERVWYRESPLKRGSGSITMRLLAELFFKWGYAGWSPFLKRRDLGIDANGQSTRLNTIDGEIIPIKKIQAASGAKSAAAGSNTPHTRIDAPQVRDK